MKSHNVKHIFYLKHIWSFTDKWEVCKGEVETLREPLSYGPARRIAENKFYIVVGKIS